MKIFNIHNHSTHSINDAIGTPEQWAKYIAKYPNKYAQGLSLSEHGSLNGIIETYNAAKKYNLKYVPSVEIYMTNKYDFENPLKTVKGHLVLLGLDRTGFEQIIEINNRAIKRNQIVKTKTGKKTTVITVDILRDVIKENQGHLICSGACIGGFWNLPVLLDNDIDLAETNLKKIIDIFGKENTYIEYQVFYDKEEKQRKINYVNKLLKKKYDLKAIVASDAHNIKKEDGIYQPLAVAMGWKVNIKKYYEIVGQNAHHTLWLKEYNDFLEALNEHDFAITKEDVDEAVQETLNIFNSIQDINLHKEQKFVYHNLTEEEKLAKFDKLVKQGWIKKIHNVIPDEEEQGVYFERLKHEIQVLKKKKFIDYFLAVQEIISKGRDRGIIFGAGRGSSASSLVSYLLDITTLNPITYNLLFERFISENRIDYPDIDIDCSEREEVVNLIQELYPESDVTVVANKGKFGLKNLINSIFKVLNIRHPKRDHVQSGYYYSSLVDKYELDQFDVDAFMDLKEVKELDEYMNKKFKGKYDLRTMLDLFMKNIYSIGVHAGGVCILPCEQKDVPLTPLSSDKYAYGSGYAESASYRELEYVGYIKFDFLGIRTLRIFEDTFEMLKEQGKMSQETINDLLLYKGIDINEEIIYDRINTGYTDGFFQIGSKGMKKLLAELTPKNINELAQILALFRPGPLKAGMSRTMKSAKENPNAGMKLWPEDLLKHIEHIIKPTNYHILYQEQLMFLGREIGDYNIVDLNDFRNFLSKGYHLEVTKPKLFKEWNDKFYNNFVNNGMKKNISKESLEELWYKMKEFSKYSFVKSHAISYAYSSFMCAYLAHHYPIEWFTSVLRHEDPIEFLPIVKEQLKNLQLDINIVTPKVNNIYINPTIVDEKNIVLGINQIKGIGPKAAIELSKIKGHYDSFDEFLDSSEYSKHSVNKGVIVKLIMIDFFKSVGEDRADLLRRYELSKMSKKKRKNIVLNEENYLEVLYDYTGNEDLFYYQKELEMIGTPISDFPYHKLVEEIDNFMVHEVKKNKRDDSPIYMDIIAGIDSIKIKRTKTNKKYYSVKFRTIEGKTYWCNVFTRSIAKIKNRWKINLENDKKYKNELFMFYYGKNGNWLQFFELIPIKRFLEDQNEN